MADGRIIIDTKIDNSGAEKGINDLGKIASSGLKLAAGAVTGFGVALGGISAYAIQTGMDFEASMSQVKAVSGTTGSEIAALTDKAKEMGAKTKFSASESADAFLYMAQAGWKTSDMLGGIEGVMNLAAASGADLASTSEIVTSALTAFGLKASDSAHFADVLARAAADSNLNITDLGYSFKYVAPIAGSLKYSIEDTALALELMANAGIKGEQAGTSLRAILTRMVDPPKDAATALDALGISMTNTNGTMKPLNQVLSELRQKFSGLSDSQKASYAASIAGQEGMSGLLAIVNASDEDFNTLSQSINNANGSAADMAKTMQDNLKGKLEQLGGALETLGLTLYEKFEGPMKEAVDTVSGALGELNKSLDSGELSASADAIAQGFANLVQGAATFIANYLPKIIDGLAWIMEHASEIASGIAGIGAAILTMNVANIILGVARAFQEAKKAQEGLTVAQWLFNAAVGANPIGLIVAAIAGLITALVVLWNTNEGFRNAVISIWTAISTTVGTVLTAIVNFFTVTIPAAFTSFITFISQLPATIGSFFAQIPTIIGNFFNLALTTITTWGANVLSWVTTAIPNIITSVINFFNELPGKIGYALGYALGTIVKWGVEAWNYLTTNVPKWIEGIGKWFSELPGKIWQWLLNTIAKIKEWGTNTYTTAINFVTNTINGIVNWFAQLPGRIWQWLLNTISKVAQWGPNMAAKGRQAASNLVSSVVNIVSNLPGKMLEIGKNVVKGIWSGITGMAGWLKDKVSDFVSGIVNGFKDGLDIHSPSRVMRDLIGRNIPKGIGVGIDLETPDLNRKIQNNIDDLTAKLRGTVDFETARTTAQVVARNNYSIDNNVDSNDRLDKMADAIKDLAKRPIQTSINMDGKAVAEATNEYHDNINGKKVNLSGRGLAL